MNRDHAILLTIVTAIEDINNHTQWMNMGDFCDDLKTYDASCMKLQIIWELVSDKLNENSSISNISNIEEIKQFRDKITHHYMGLSDELVWNIIQEFLPVLEKDIRKILKSFT